MQDYLACMGLSCLEPTLCQQLAARRWETPYIETNELLLLSQAAEAGAETGAEAEAEVAALPQRTTAAQAPPQGCAVTPVTAISDLRKTLFKYRFPNEMKPAEDCKPGIDTFHRIGMPASWDFPMSLQDMRIAVVLHGLMHEFQAYAWPIPEASTLAALAVHLCLSSGRLVAPAKHLDNNTRYFTDEEFKVLTIPSEIPASEPAAEGDELCMTQLPQPTGNVPENPETPPDPSSEQDQVPLMILPAQPGTVCQHPQATLGLPVGENKRPMSKPCQPEAGQQNPQSTTAPPAGGNEVSTSEPEAGHQKLHATSGPPAGSDEVPTAKPAQPCTEQQTPEPTFVTHFKHAVEAIPEMKLKYHGFLRAAKPSKAPDPVREAGLIGHEPPDQPAAGLLPGSMPPAGAALAISAAEAQPSSASAAAPAGGVASTAASANGRAGPQGASARQAHGQVGTVASSSAVESAATSLPASTETASSESVPAADKDASCLSPANPAHEWHSASRSAGVDGAALLKAAAAEAGAAAVQRANEAAAALILEEEEEQEAARCKQKKQKKKAQAIGARGPTPKGVPHQINPDKEVMPSPGGQDTTVRLLMYLALIMQLVMSSLSTDRACRLASQFRDKLLMTPMMWAFLLACCSHADPRG